MKLSRRNLKLDLTGDDIRLLQSELVQLGLPIPKAEQDRAAFLQGTYDAVVRFQREHSLKPTGVVNAETARAINAAVGAPPGTATSSSGGPGPTSGATSPTVDGEYTVTGTVFSPDRAGVGGLTVEIVDKNAGPDVSLGKAITDDRGRYQTSISAAILSRNGKTQLDLQARVLAGGTFLAASEVEYNATGPVTLNVSLPANCAALPSEWETLTAALAALYKDPLGTLQENGARHDITYLANKTGWDARAVALAALADQFSRNQPPAPAGKAKGPTPQGIPAPFYYALFRAGLPSNADTLYRTSVSVVQRMWGQAIAQGVIPKTLEEQIPVAAATYQALSAPRLLDVRVLEGTSTLKEMLQLTLGDDAQAQQRFADLFAGSGGDLEHFWSDVERTFGEATTARLKLDCQLGYLTLNNAPLMSALHAAERAQPLASTLDLAQRGYYDPAKWQGLFGDTIPAGFPGATPDEQKSNYARFLAAQVRLSFPTAVVADRVRSGEFRLTAPEQQAGAVRDAIHGFLTKHQGAFEIGVQPIEQYLKLNNLQGELSGEPLAQLKRLQRVYQITPHDEAMKGLLENGIGSAYQIARYDQGAFVRAFGSALGGDETARQTHARAREVHNAVLNIAVSYLTAQRNAPIGAHSDAQTIDGGSKGNDGVGVVTAFPTLEGMGLSGDYCSCEECRSWLSPAAYLVDLLDFIDLPQGKVNPQDVLFARRPDIQHLPLTCENTNGLVLAIDLGNEALEYFVNHLNGKKQHSLENYQGHNTDDRPTSDELLASPPNLDDAAYETLKGEYFPPPLPFYQPLEALRRYFNRFELPLYRAMEVLRTSEEVDPGAGYGWRDILLERLRISRQEYLALSDQTQVTLAQLAGIKGDDMAARTALTWVRAFVRRFDLTYDEIVALLKTVVVNPASALIPKLERLGLSFATIDALHKDPNTPITLPQGLDTKEFGNDVPAWVAANYAQIAGLITIAAPVTADTPCAPDQFTFRYASPDQAAKPLRAVDFVRLLRVIRLWKKLDWSIEQTALAVAALSPDLAKTPDPDDGKALKALDAGFQTLLPRLGEVAEVMERLDLDVGRDLPGLLACWAPIDCGGEASLYRALFLGHTQPPPDQDFGEDGAGRAVLAGKILDHVETLCAAFNLRGEELNLIVATLTADKTTPFDGLLTIGNISAVYRRGWLARRLRISVRELLLLITYTGLDPFKPLDPPNPPMINLITLVDALRSVGLKPTQALYLIWNQDLSGKSSPTERQITELARVLRATCAAVETDFAVPDDPSDDLARARLALVYGRDVADEFFSLINDTITFTTNYSQPQSILDAALAQVAPDRLTYDDLRKKLSVTGVIDDATRQQLEAPAAATAEFKTAVKALYNAGQAALNSLWERYPDLKMVYGTYRTAKGTRAENLANLLKSLLQTLKGLRKTQQVLAAVAATAGVDGAFAKILLDDVMVLESAGNGKQPAVDDLTALEQPGLAVAAFWQVVQPAPPDYTADYEPTLDYAPKPHPLPGDAPLGVSVQRIWRGYLEVPETSSYGIAIETDAAPNAVSVTLDGHDVKLALDGLVLRNTDPLSLTGGVLYSVSLSVKGTPTSLRVGWESMTRGREVVPAQYLYSETAVRRVRDAYLRLLKSAALAAALRLTPKEIAFLSKDPDHAINKKSWLNALPVSGDPDSSVSVPFTGVLTALLDYASFKAELAPDDERLLQALGGLRTKQDDGWKLLMSMSGWSGDAASFLATRFKASQWDLATLSLFHRVRDAYAAARTLGVAVTALADAVGNNPKAETVGALQSALRARYARADWLAVLRPISDALRGLQRDALVAYALKELGPQGYDTPEKLFEYFLMDLEMEPCRQTSRIRHALSSVQLFIERCLLNLEKDVPLSSVDPDQWDQIRRRWEWMKRYRVWQANREIFLWPQNWAYSGLRDDQSPFFKETMSRLFQGDVTDDTGTVALLDYLSQAEEVAQLVPCGMFYGGFSAGKDDATVHVVARTAGAHRKYFYRRYDTISWSPWEQIKLDIEGDPVTPVIWDGRLLLFWLRVQKHADMTPRIPTPGSDASGKLSSLKASDLPTAAANQVTMLAVLCWSEFYNGKWQPAKTSDLDAPIDIETKNASSMSSFDRTRFLLQPVQEDSGGLRIIVRNGTYNAKGWFLLYTTHSAPVSGTATSIGPSETSVPYRRFSPYVGDVVSLDYYAVGSVVDSNTLPDTVAVIAEKNPMKPAGVEPLNVTTAPLEKPFFVSDNQYCFYVLPSGVSIVPLSDVQDVGSFSFRETYQHNVPPMVFQGDPPSDASRAQGQNIIRTIPTGATIKFGSSRIGVSGSVGDLAGALQAGGGLL